jgi:hypothetical protein
MCANSLTDLMFRTIDGLHPAILTEPIVVLGKLKIAIDEAGGYWSKQLEDYADMLLSEYCGASVES